VRQRSRFDHNIEIFKKKKEHKGAKEEEMCGYYAD
jgi:hypothetical protein